jgi:hypothetical protein
VAGLYDSVFLCWDGTKFVLRIDLTGTEPLVQLFGCVAEHPLLDADMYVRIACHDNKLLGAAVMETIVQMQSNPPRILSFTDNEVEAMQPPVPPVNEAAPVNEAEDVSALTPDSAFAVSEVGPVTIPTLMPDPAVARLSFKHQVHAYIPVGGAATGNNTTRSVISADDHHYIWAGEAVPVPYPSGGAPFEQY